MWIYCTRKMESYCVLTLLKNTANKNSTIRTTKQNKLMLVPNCTICSNK